MTKKDLLERLDSIKEDFDDLIDEIENGDDQEEEQRPAHSVFVMPFAAIKRMIQAGLIDLFNVGDQVINKHEKFGPIVWDIIGKNHDKPANGDGPTLTLQMHDVLPGVYVYDTESDAFPYGHAHYPSSTIRNTLNTEILNGFSEEDRAAMVEVDKVTYQANDDGGKPETTADKLFLLSCSEVGFTGEYVRPEGDVYEYYDGMPARRCKAEPNDREQARGWWLRSPYPDYAYIARIVYTSGAQNSYVACSGDGAAAACVIG